MEACADLSRWKAVLKDGSPGPAPARRERILFDDRSGQPRVSDFDILRVRRWGLLLLGAVLSTTVVAPVAVAATIEVCYSVADVSGLAKVECHSCESGSKPPKRRAGSGASEPMMWVREYGTGAAEGYTWGCELWPVSKPLPPSYVRVTAESCGFEKATPARPSKAEVEATVRSLAGELRMPVPSIVIGPDPAANEWNMAVVGLPVWLWTDTPRTASSTASVRG